MIKFAFQKSGLSSHVKDGTDISIPGDHPQFSCESMNPMLSHSFPIPGIAA
jgi:hypothetical protein